MTSFVPTHTPCNSAGKGSGVIASLNYADEQRETAQNFPDEGAKRCNAVVSNARGENFTLQRDGFQLVNADPMKRAVWRSSPRDDDLLKSVWYPEAAQFVKNLTGASSTIVLNHVHRSSASKHAYRLTIEEADRAGVQGKGAKVELNGVDGIHADAAPDSMYIKQIEAQMQQQYDEQHQAAGDFTAGQKRIRVEIVNVWQSISELGPIQRKPLCIAHPDSVRPSELRKNYKKNNGNTVYNLAQTPASKHEWWYYSEMQLGEMLVFYGYHETMPVMHTAFDLPETPISAPPRESLETRVLCVFEDDVVDSTPVSVLQL